MALKSQKKKKKIYTEYLYTHYRSSAISISFLFLFFFFFFFFLFAISWAAPSAYGGSQARGHIGAVATSLRQSHSSVGSKLRLQPTPQLTATPDP